MRSNSLLLKLVKWASALLLLSAASGAFAFGTTARFVLLTNQDSQFSTTGTGWINAFPPSDAGSNPTFYGEYYATHASAASETATARWEFGVLAPAPAPYSFEFFVPDTSANSGTSVNFRLESAGYNFLSGCGTYGTAATFTGINLDSYEGRWVQLGTANLATGTCYRLVVSNNTGSTGQVIPANAVRAERLLESNITITDMPRLTSVLTAGTTNITSTSNAVPTIVTTMTVTCPQDGSVMVVGSGESAAVTNVAGTNFNGLAYSISKNSTATDNSNVVQSSALATFSGDANRDFLNVQRTDTCTAGQSITYRLTGYRSQTATGPGSFIWNGRLVGQYFAGSF